MVKLTFLAVATLAVFSSLAPQQAEAHSWMECVDWRRNKGVSKNDWRTSKGWCAGFARRFPVKNTKTALKDFGSLDDTEYSRHYRQDHHPDKKGDKHPDHDDPCSNGHNGLEEGTDETPSTAKNPAYGGKWGPMTVTKVGKELCLRWPAKNHAAPKTSVDTIVYVTLSTRAGKDPKQKELDAMAKDKKVVAQFKLPYRNCNDAADQGQKPGSSKFQDRRPCGGCFKVPKRAPGIYLLQWRWTLNKGKKPVDDETYTSCADIRITK